METISTDAPAGRLVGHRFLLSLIRGNNKIQSVPPPALSPFLFSVTLHPSCCLGDRDVRKPRGNTRPERGRAGALPCRLEAQGVLPQQRSDPLRGSSPTHVLSLSGPQPGSPPVISGQGLQPQHAHVTVSAPAFNQRSGQATELCDNEDTSLWEKITSRNSLRNGPKTLQVQANRR